MRRSWRDVALWALAVVLAGVAGLLIWHIAVAPPQGAVAAAAQEKQAGPKINDVTVSHPAGGLGYLSTGRSSEVIAGTDEGVKVYELREYNRQYNVRDATQGAEGEGKAGTGKPRPAGY